MIRYLLRTDYDEYRNQPQSKYPSAQKNPLSASESSPSYGQPPSETSRREGEQYLNREGSYPSQDTSRVLSQRPQPPPQQQQLPPPQQQKQQPTPQQQAPSPQLQQVPSPRLQPQQHQQQQQQQLQEQPPSPTRKSMFDFISPFDALASSGASPAKKKPVPQSQLPQTEVSSGNEDSWTSASLSSDPKRKSVENLMEQLTRGQGPHQPQASSPPYDRYLAGDDFSQSELIQPRAAPPPPLPPRPSHITSPRASPPKLQAQAQHRPPPRSVESPVGPQASVPGRRDRESSPIPGQRGGWKTENKAKGPGAKGKTAK